MKLAETYLRENLTIDYFEKEVWAIYIVCSEQYLGVIDNNHSIRVYHRKTGELVQYLSAVQYKDIYIYADEFICTLDFEGEVKKYDIKDWYLLFKWEKSSFGNPISKIKGSKDSVFVLDSKSNLGVLLDSDNSFKDLTLSGVNDFFLDNKGLSYFIGENSILYDYFLRPVRDMHISETFLPFEDRILFSDGNNLYTEPCDRILDISKYKFKSQGKDCLYYSDNGYIRKIDKSLATSSLLVYDHSLIDDDQLITYILSDTIYGLSNGLVRDGGNIIKLEQSNQSIIYSSTCIYPAEKEKKEKVYYINKDKNLCVLDYPSRNTSKLLADYPCKVKDFKLNNSEKKILIMTFTGEILIYDIDLRNIEKVSHSNIISYYVYNESENLGNDLNFYYIDCEDKISWSKSYISAKKGFKLSKVNVYNNLDEKLKGLHFKGILNTCFDVSNNTLAIGNEKGEVILRDVVNNKKVVEKTDFIGLCVENEIVDISLSSCGEIVSFLAGTKVYLWDGSSLQSVNAYGVRKIKLSQVNPQTLFLFTESRVYIYNWLTKNRSEKMT